MSTRSTTSAGTHGGLDDERAEESALNLLRRDLMAVVPERPDLLGAEAVRVALARQAPRSASRRRRRPPRSGRRRRASGWSRPGRRPRCGGRPRRGRLAEPGAQARGTSRRTSARATTRPDASGTSAARAVSSKWSSGAPSLGPAQVGDACAADPMPFVVRGHRPAAVVVAAVGHDAVRAGQPAVPPRLSEEREHARRWRRRRRRPRFGRGVPSTSRGCSHVRRELGSAVAWRPCPTFALRSWAPGRLPSTQPLRCSRARIRASRST